MELKKASYREWPNKSSSGPQSRQSAKLFLQSSELGLPQPLTRRRVCPLPLDPGGGAHSLAREGVGESQFLRGDIGTRGTLYKCVYFAFWTFEIFLLKTLFCSIFLGIPQLDVKNKKLNNRECRPKVETMTWASSNRRFPNDHYMALFVCQMMKL